ncbi:MAG: hypothetical protein ACJ79S_19455 [Gemmatimonadaceae bacterium]
MTASESTHDRRRAGTAAPESHRWGTSIPEALHHLEEVLVHAADALLDSTEPLLALPEPPASRWHRAGVTPRGERIFNVVSGLVLVLFAAGWAWSIAMARAEAAETDSPDAVTPVTAGIAAALTDGDAPTTAYLTDAAVNAFAAAESPLRGESGRLRARIQPAGAPILEDSLPAGAQVAVSASGKRVAGAGLAAPATRSPDSSLAAAPRTPGVWEVALQVGSAIRPVADFNIITLTPFSEKRRGRIGLYYIGNWPTERGRGRGNAYAPPRGFIEVTRENQDTPLSEHFRLRDFLTHDQQDVWPKYLVVDTKLVDKLELVLADLASRGVDVRGVRVMSGFRTPQYNASGGDPSGRAGLSRHMYGDAADIFIDSNGDGTMDDLNGDHRVNIEDARVIERAVERVEREHPTLVGGCGVYVAAGGHGPFAHVDTRGFRARWVGSGDG